MIFIVVCISWNNKNCFKILILVIIFQRKSSYTAEKFTDCYYECHNLEDLNLPFTTVDTNFISEIPL